MSPEVFIPLTRGLVTVIDFDDFDKVRDYKWHAHVHRNDFCPARTSYPEKKTIRMHREIMKAPVGLVVDHITGDALDNRRSNLRLCTPEQNGCNTRRHSNNSSGFKGVRRHPTSRGFQAFVQRSNPKQFSHLGIFKTAEEAAKAYDVAALKHFGEFARLNFPTNER